NKERAASSRLARSLASAMTPDYSTYTGSRAPRTRGAPLPHFDGAILASLVLSADYTLIMPPRRTAVAISARVKAPDGPPSTPCRRLPQHRRNSFVQPRP